MTDRAPTSVHRIHIIGGPGSGKSVLAARVASIIGVPVVHLDEVARLGGGIGPERPIEDRMQAVRGILDKPGWVTEGVHLGWTDDLLKAAEIVVWLDYLDWRDAAQRIVKRFVAGALEEMHRQRGLRKLIRFRDYLRQFRGLLRAIPETRRYYETPLGRAPDAVGWEPTRALTATGLLAGDPKLVHCREANDLRQFIRHLERSVALSSPIDSPGHDRSSC